MMLTPLGPPMQQIAEWLKKLGMSEYAQRFAESDIDIDVLSELTDQDFDRLGVSLGHRRRMLRAIRELGASPIAVFTERQVSAPTDQEPAPKDTAERRQVTVMFSDLVGSTALSARMDPEDFARGHFGLSEVRCGDRAVASEASLQSTWATVSSSTSAIRRRTRTMLSELFALGWSWSLP